MTLPIKPELEATASESASELCKALSRVRLADLLKQVTVEEQLKPAQGYARARACLEELLTPSQRVVWKRVWAGASPRAQLSTHLPK